MLAVLLINANKPTPPARIVDAVWRDEPPLNGTNVVQKYVAGLRRVLAPGQAAHSPGQLLALTDSGYVLRVKTGCLDVDLFHQLVRQARAARADGRLADAAQTLQSAVSLWRADALAGVAGSLFDTTRGQLANDRASALELWAEIELDRGHHAPLAPELTRLVAEFPLRERLRYLMMLALYRCGRQAESLAAYHDIRRFLADEFGIEPGRPLQQLNLRILRADPALEAPNGSDRLGERSPVSESSAGTAPHLSWPPPATSSPDPAVPTSYRVGRRSMLTGVLLVLIPLATFGLAGWAVIAFFAVKRRSIPLGLCATGYLALSVVFVVVANLSPDAESLPSTADTAAFSVALLVTWLGTAAHAALLGVSGHRSRS